MSGAMITARAVLHGRPITTEVESGLTCIGNAVSTLSGNGGCVIIGGDSTILESTATDSTAEDSTATGPLLN